MATFFTTSDETDIPKEIRDKVRKERLPRPIGMTPLHTFKLQTGHNEYDYTPVYKLTYVNNPELTATTFIKPPSDKTYTVQELPRGTKRKHNGTLIENDNGKKPRQSSSHKSNPDEMDVSGGKRSRCKRIRNKNSRRTKRVSRKR